MSSYTFSYLALDDWLTRNSIPFSLDTPESLNAAVDKLIASLGDEVQLLGLGEPLHGSDDILLFRNRVFERLVEAHSFTAIAIESSFPRSRIVNDFVHDRCTVPYESIQDTGFSYGFRGLEGNRQLVEWMRAYNTDPNHRDKLQFHGFDSPTEMMRTDSPRQLLHFALDYFAEVDPANAQSHRERIDTLLGNDADWENPAAMMDPSKAVGLSPAATAVRIATEDLITELQIRRPELIAKSDSSRYSEAAYYASSAQQLLNYHAALARPSENRTAELLGIRDSMMADNLAYIVARESGRVLAFAHNSHLKRGMARWQLGPNDLRWWPAGSHLTEMLGPRYAVIGTAVGVSESQGIGQPEPGTLEDFLFAAPGPARFIPTHGRLALPTEAINALPIRSGSATNHSYFPLTAQSFTDFDWLAAINRIA